MSMNGLPSNSKFGRTYYISIQIPQQGTIIIQPPFTIECDITRNSLSSANVCQVRIYNLAANTRNSIHYNAASTTEFSSIILNAGYGNNLTNIFSGNISRAWSVREGVNFITQIECFDGGFATVNGQVNANFPAGTPIQSVILYIMNQLPNVTFGAIGTFPGILTKGKTFTGNPAQLLYELTGGAFFIDGAKSYCLKNNEFNPAHPPILINAITGLLNTPVLEQTIARFEMLFEPTLNVGGLAILERTTNVNLNGTYIITGVKHRGIISPVVSGSFTTIGEFVYLKVPIPGIAIP